MSGAPDSAAQAAAADSQSSRFSSTEGEIIVFRSVDGILFNIHRRNLQSTTNGPLAEDFLTTADETVQLTEDAKTLEILFTFVYPGVYPSVADMPYTDLALVAEAAEKYRVAPEIGMCHLAIRLGTLHNTHAIEVLQFADKHCHYDLLDLAAPYTVNMNSGCTQSHVNFSVCGMGAP